MQTRLNLPPALCLLESVPHQAKICGTLTQIQYVGRNQKSRHAESQNSGEGGHIQRQRCRSLSGRVEVTTDSCTNGERQRSQAFQRVNPESSTKFRMGKLS